MVIRASTYKFEERCNLSHNNVYRFQQIYIRQSCLEQIRTVLFFFFSFYMLFFSWQLQEESKPSPCYSVVAQVKNYVKLFFPGLWDILKVEGGKLFQTASRREGGKNEYQRMTEMRAGQLESRLRDVWDESRRRIDGKNVQRLYMDLTEREQGTSSLLDLII